MSENQAEMPGPAKDSDGLAATIPGESAQAENLEPDQDLGDYRAMFREYVAAQTWIGPADQPLVFHLRKLCAQLDANPDAPAAVSSAYLQAFSRLDRRRPGATHPGDGLVPVGEQPSIFDPMD